ncbi:MAG: response regulator [Ignavibacteriaceae bacterium]|jgi:signal transduction histidine kinase
MTEKVKILHLEDDDLDAELLKNILLDEQIDCDIALVQDRRTFQDALTESEFDLIFSDNSLPSFDGIDALRFAKKVQPNTPFIFFSGTLDEDVAIEAMRWGATDYVLKNKLSKLGVTAKRVLSNSRQKKELNRANEKIKENEARLKVSLSMVNIAVFQQDKELKYTWMCQPQLNYSHDQVVGKTDFDLLPYDAAVEVTRIKQAVLANNCLMRSEIEVSQNGQTHYFDLVAEPLLDHDGNCIGITGASLDISAQKVVQKELLEAKEKAEEMNRLKTNFLANMSHELRTPLVSILGFTEILKSEPMEADHLDMINNIHRGGKRLNETLNLILSFSDFEANQVRLEKTNIKIVPLTKTLMDEFTEEAESKNLSFKLIEREKNLSLFLDERLLSGILKHIIGNAIKFTKQGGVTIEIGKETLFQNKDEASHAFIKVKDTGIGIEEKNLELIFDEFRQVSEGFARNFEGNGLGLTIAKKITELMGGSITVESKIGVGSTFTVKFPALKTSAEEIISPIEKLKSLQTNGSKEGSKSKELPVMLHVEDDEMNHNVVKLFLKDCCKVEYADNGEVALQMMQQKLYDGFLLDINLGFGMDGIEVAREIKKRLEYNHTPVIAVTAFAMEGDEKEFLDAGCTHYISKPFLKTKFVSTVKSALEK